MKINEYGGIQQTGRMRKKNGADAASGFSDLLGTEEAESAPGGAARISSTANIGLMLGIQEVSDEEVSRKQLIKQGNNLLDSLEAIRNSLLSGRLSLDVLSTLEQRLNRQREMTSDPALHAIMDDIELRAAVELAKIETALNRRNTSPDNSV